MEMRLKIFENTFQIAAQAHGRPDGLRVVRAVRARSLVWALIRARACASRCQLAYPGWLDNAGSFKFLGAELAKLGCFVVAVDPPGCGFSDHVPRCSFYNDFDEVATLLEIAEALGWSEPFIVMAHSRGGGIALAAAGALPHRFKGVILLDSFATLTTGGIGYEDVQPSERASCCVCARR